MSITLSTTRARQLPFSFLIDPFDLTMFHSQEGYTYLHTRFATFLHTLQERPCRLVTWHTPADLQPLIGWTIDEQRQTNDPWRAHSLDSYRQWYHQLQRDSNFLHAKCGLTVWTDNPSSGSATAATAEAYFGTTITEAKWPALLQGDYRLAWWPVRHLEPIGRPTGRPLVCILSSYEFVPSEWSFYNPMIIPFGTSLPLAVCLDIPKSWSRSDAVAKLDSIITALSVHLSTSRSLDSTSQRQIEDCKAAIVEIQNGHALHEVQIKVALFAPDAATLKDEVSKLKQRMSPFVKMRTEIDQVTNVRYFSDTLTSQIGDATLWPMTSPTTAMLMSFLGLRRMNAKKGIVRGFGTSNHHDPYIYDDWSLTEGKKATHEIWVGTTGAGKTFALNCFLARSLSHYGTPFDLLEPMGHGRLLANVFHITPYSLSARETCLNPQDPVYDTLGEQNAHVIRLYETILKRPLSGSKDANMQMSVLSEALTRAYKPFSLRTMTPGQAPTISQVCELIETVGKTDGARTIARELAEEIGGLATGSGPYAYFLDGHTNIDFSIAHESQPRIFCFDQLENDDTLIAIGYSQVLSTLMRTAMTDDSPRIIAVDEVWRLMRHPALLQFLISAVKTLRTKRKKVIMIDQQMRIFLQDKDTRLLFENSPIRLIFSQKGGEDIFANDAAFAHYTDRHRQIISSLSRFHFLMETPEGLFSLISAASLQELYTFRSS